jgi:hypothetical protein
VKRRPEDRENATRPSQRTRDAEAGAEPATLPHGTRAVSRAPAPDRPQEWSTTRGDSMQPDGTPRQAVSREARTEPAQPAVERSSQKRTAVLRSRVSRIQTP